MIPRIFEGGAVIIVAGGPSLRGFDWRRLKDKNVIAINRAYEVVPSALVLWWSDAKFWFHHREGLLAHRAPWKATCNLNYGSEPPPPEIHQYRFTGHKGLDPDEGCLRSGNNSAFAAIHLAVHLGALDIVLLGADMKHGPHGETHFHTGHGVQHQEDTLTELMLPWFDSLAAPLAARGITVTNASVDSALTTWPRCTIDQGLGQYERD